MESNTQYTFNVESRFTKTEIKHWVELFFGVKVVAVNSHRLPGKGRRMGPILGHTRHYRRVLAAEEHIWIELLKGSRKRVILGVVMSFYGIAGLFISSYLWCTILWNVGSGYDRFDRKEGIVSIFRWGFPGIKRRIFLRFLMRDIQSIRIQVKEGFYPRRILYMEIRGQGVIPLTRTDDKFFTPREIEQKAAELAYFLCVPIEVF
ncbi:hypothetical protein ACP4OV_031258 [Aristida adscensionis]